MTTLVRNGTIVTAERTYEADILIEGETIKDIAPNLPSENADKIVDAAGMYVLPGGIDVHTHLDMPFGGTTSSDDFETGTRAAA
ncbi:MAG: dihydropyrimidinase, partial [Bryobacteraceae bacterium]